MGQSEEPEAYFLRVGRMSIDIQMRERDARQELSLIAYSAVNIWVFDMSLRPMNGKDRCFEKLLISVFLAHILHVEVFLR